MAHPRRNFLAKIKVNEVWLTEEDEIKEGVPEAFFNLLSDLLDQGLGINEMYFDILDMQKGKKNQRSCFQRKRCSVYFQT